MNPIAATWFSANKNKFNPQHQAIIQQRLEEIDDKKVAILSSVELKDPVVLFIVELFFGGFGIHRFILGDAGMGILMFLTGGLCGILWFFDLFTIVGKTKDYNYRTVMPYIC